VLKSVTEVFQTYVPSLVYGLAYGKNSRANYHFQYQWRAEGGGKRGAGPGHPRQGGIQRVKL